MTNADLIDFVAKRANLTRKQSTLALEAVVVGVRAALRRNTAASISGLGRFTKKTWPARDGFNPRTRDPIRIQSTKVVNFQAADGMKKAMND